MKTLKQVFILISLMMIASAQLAYGQPEKQRVGPSNENSGDGEQIKTGAFDLEIKLSDIVDIKELAHISPDIHEDSISSWHIYVPETYDLDNPPGVLVYISPTPRGAPPDSWYPVLQQENMIFISANDHGNTAPTNRRIANTLIALKLINTNYTTNSDKKFISGFSGGARVSCLLIESIPNLFKGALLMGGAFKWKGSKTGLNNIIENGQFVFVTGREDHARREVIKTYRQYKKIDQSKVLLIDDRQLGHNLPKAKQFEEALSFLSSE